MVTNLVGHFEQEGEHKLGNSRATVAGNVGHRDATLGCCLDIDDVVACGCDSNVAQLRQCLNDLAIEDRLVGDDRLGTGAAGNRFIQWCAIIDLADADLFEGLPAKVTGVCCVGIKEDNLHL